MKTSHIFYIEPFCYLNYDKRKVIIVNTLSNEKKIMNIDEVLTKYIREIIKRKNRWIKLDKLDIEKRSIRDFVKNIKQIYCGDLIDFKESLPPYLPKNELVVEEDRHIFQDQNYEGEFRIECLTEYLHEITISNNIFCEIGCSYCSNAYKQLNCCTRGTEVNSNISKTIEELIKQLNFYSIKRINLVLGSCEIDSSVSCSIKKLSKMTFSINIIIHYKRLNYKKIKYLMNISSFLELEIIIDEYITENEIEILNKIYLKYQPNVKFTFLVYSSNSLLSYEKLSNRHKFSKLNLRPIYNGKNKTFLKKLLMISVKELIDKKINIEELEINKTVNRNYFGKIFIDQNGFIKSSRNSVYNFKLDNDSIKKMMLKELKSNAYWKLTRTILKSCKDCVFNQLCPPISDISILLEVENLCNYKKIKKYKEI